ncbi:MAG: sugar phosphate isomerase/epimerase [Clostridia bacterium]|nr:sugar phosphate isomerase/epimerase [Clostridia bacterium]
MEKGINLFCYDNGEKLDIEGQIELMKENGFGHTFFLGDSPLLTDSLVDKVKRSGIVFDTLHAPFDGINAMWKDGTDGDEMLKRLCETVDRCSGYEIPVAVVHLSSGRPAPVISDIGNYRFKELVEYAEKKNVTLAFENQRFVANLASILEQHTSAGFCWDVGHEGCFTNGRHYMPLFGERLSAVHLHDNHHVQDEDEHLLPYDGICDFDYVAKTLADYHFGGTLMLEVFRSESKRYDGFSPQEYYRRAGEAIKKLDDAVKKYK